ncbi:MAG: methyltransferase domain-containing protein [Oxalobacteraceae bacterium]|nr:MAG: methyltransferase domain-containing protein [Oxalobacteraceae bacterium]
MSDWTSGYVADIGYTHGFYRELTPAVLDFIALSKGQRSPDSAGPLAYCELGCGQGYSANLLAAANPQIQFHATDFNPAHIVGARALASAAGTENVHFYDDAFADFLNRPELPQFDVISLHGIYSWIGAEHRATIVEFIRRKLKPGGLVYISYNCLPGWSPGAPVRHLMYLHGKAQGGPTIGRLDPALGFIDKLIAADAKYFAANPALKARHEALTKQNKNYLAHEYLNDAWTLFYHSDVAAELGEAKVGYLGSANLLDHIDAVNFTADQKAILEQVTEPVLRETVRDYIVNQQFRRDVFSKGAIPLPDSVRREAWLDHRFALMVARADVSMKIRGGIGEADLHADVYGPILDALAGGPVTVRHLVDGNPAVAALGWNRLAEALVILVGSGQVQPCLPARTDAKRHKSTKAFNSAVLRHARDSADLQQLASPVTGGGVPLSRFQQLFLLALESGRKGTDDAAQFAWEVLQQQGQAILKDGKPLNTPEENLAELQRQAAAFFEKLVPVLRQLQVV